jgi:hypothetical protein
MKDDRNNEHEVVVSVKDTGTGIDPVVSSILFTKFATKAYVNLLLEPAACIFRNNHKRSRSHLDNFLLHS